MNEIYIDVRPREGRPVVFLHGVYFDHHLWDEVRSALPGRTTLAVDMPGHGQSRPLGDGESVEDVAATIATAVRAAGVKDAVWVGHSWGGMTLARLLANAPDLIAAALFVSTPTRRNQGVGRFGFLAQRALLRLGLPASVYGRIAARALYDPMSLAEQPNRVDEMAARLDRMGRTQVIRTLTAVLIEAGDSIEALASSRVPTRILIGQTDGILSDEVRTRFAPRLDVARRGHITPHEDPQAIVHALAALDTALGASEPRRH